MALFAGYLAVGPNTQDPGEGETPHMNGVGVLVGNFELNQEPIKPLKETDGRGPSIFWPLKETMSKHRQYILLYFFRVQP